VRVDPTLGRQSGDRAIHEAAVDKRQAHRFRDPPADRRFARGDATVNRNDQSVSSPLAGEVALASPPCGEVALASPPCGEVALASPPCGEVARSAGGAMDFLS